MVYNSIQAVGLTQKLTMGKENAEIIINFTTGNFIPASGSLEIVFPGSVASIRPHCRSVTGLNSGLLATSGASGEVGCAVQNGNHWVITSFQPVAAGTTIVIRGFIDLPSLSGSIGSGEIISYIGTDSVNIYQHGNRIDYIAASFALNVSSSPTMNPNANTFLTQRSVLRQNDIA
jgi:hypothetical protein